MLQAPSNSGTGSAIVLCALLACASKTDQPITAQVEEPSTVDAGGASVADAGLPAMPPAAPPATPPTVVDAGPPPDPEACRKLAVLVRDFNASHPDFEKYTSDYEYRGLVAEQLGSDKTPRYLPLGRTAVTTGPAEFQHWYHDVLGINVTVPVELGLVEESKGLYVYDSEAFFPVDGAGFNQVMQGHNFSFTTEIHTSFVYHGGERFTFMGDDDLWLFVNNKLAIDLGGTHPELRGQIDLDAEVARFGLELGKSYPMDIFHAERHTPGSHFRLETSIECFVPVSLI